MSQFASALFAANFTLYPAFVHPGATLEAITDKGLILELIVRCEPDAGIVTYSKVDKKYCGPDFECYGSFDAAAGALCRR